jgi:hypothetical protein
MSATNHHHSEQEEISINLTRLDARVGVLENGLTSLGVKIDSLSSLFNASRQTNWGSIIGIATLLLGLIGGACVIIDLKSQNALMPVLIQNAISTQERGELNAEIINNRATISALQQDSARMFEKTREIEGQFKKLGDAHNTHVAEQARMNYVMWNATGKLGEYPQGPYYFPSFSQHLPIQ